MTFLPVFLFLAVAATPPDSTAIGKRLDALESHRLLGRDALDARTRGDSPAVNRFRVTLDARDAQIPDIVERALDPAVRVDTTLGQAVP